jgi:hypothetical protein
VHLLIPFISRKHSAISEPKITANSGTAKRFNSDYGIVTLILFEETAYLVSSQTQNIRHLFEKFTGTFCSIVALSVEIITDTSIIYAYFR